MRTRSHVPLDDSILRKSSAHAARILSRAARAVPLLPSLAVARSIDSDSLGSVSLTASSPVIPTAPEIVDRLAGVPATAGLTRAAVNFHIDYLAREKLRVKTPDGAESSKADWQRSALVSLALQFDLVREEHLALLAG